MPPRRGKNNKKGAAKDGAEKDDVLWETVSAFDTEEAFIEFLLNKKNEDEEANAEVPVVKYVDTFLDVLFERYAAQYEEEEEKEEGEAKENETETENKTDRRENESLDAYVGRLIHLQNEVKQMINAAEQTKKNVIGMYNNNKKPSKAQLDKIEALPELRKESNRCISKIMNEKRKLKEQILEAVLPPEPATESEEEAVKQEQESEDKPMEEEAESKEEKEEEKEEVQDTASEPEKEEEAAAEEEKGRSPSIPPPEKDTVEEGKEPEEEEEKATSRVEEEEENEPAAEEEATPTPSPPPTMIITTSNNSLPFQKLKYEGANRNQYTLALFKSLLSKRFVEEVIGEKEEDATTEGKRADEDDEKKEKKKEMEEGKSANVTLPVCSTTADFYTRYNIRLSPPTVDRGRQNNHNPTATDGKKNPSSSSSPPIPSFLALRTLLDAEYNTVLRLTQDCFPFLRVTRQTHYDQRGDPRLSPFAESWHMDYQPVTGPFRASCPLHLILYIPYAYPFRAPIAQLHHQSHLTFPHRAILSSSTQYNIKEAIFLREEGGEKKKKGGPTSSDSLWSRLYGEGKGKLPKAEGNASQEGNTRDTLLNLILKLVDTFTEKGFSSTRKAINATSASTSSSAKGSLFDEEVEDFKKLALAQARAGCTCGTDGPSMDLGFAWNYPLLTSQDEGVGGSNPEGGEEEATTSSLRLLSTAPSTPLLLPEGPYRAVYGNLLYRPTSDDKGQNFYLHLRLSAGSSSGGEAEDKATVLMVYELDGVEQFTSKNRSGDTFLRHCRSLLHDDSNKKNQRKPIASVLLSDMKKSSTGSLLLSVALHFGAPGGGGADGYHVLSLPGGDESASKAYFVVLSVPEGRCPTVFFTGEDLIQGGTRSSPLETIDAVLSDDSALKSATGCAVASSVPQLQHQYLTTPANGELKGMLVDVPFGYPTHSKRHSQWEVRPYFGPCPSLDQYYAPYTVQYYYHTTGGDYPFLCEESHFAFLRDGSRLRPGPRCSGDEALSPDYLFQSVSHVTCRKLLACLGGDSVGGGATGEEALLAEVRQQLEKEGVPFLSPRVLFLPFVREDTADGDAVVKTFTHSLQQLYRSPLASQAYAPPLQGGQYLHGFSLILLPLVLGLMSAEEKEGETKENLKEVIRSTLRLAKVLRAAYPDTVEPVCDGVTDAILHSESPSLFASLPHLQGGPDAVAKAVGAPLLEMEISSSQLMVVAAFLASWGTLENGGDTLIGSRKGLVKHYEEVRKASMPVWATLVKEFKEI